MRAGLLFELILAFSETYFRAQGNIESADYLRKVLAVKTAGGNIDAHLQKVSELLLADAPIDLEGLIDRINSEADELLGRGSGEEVPGPALPE